VLDRRYFLVNLFLTIAMQMIGFMIASLTKSEKLFDFFGGLNFIAVALFTMLLQGSFNHRTIAVFTIVCFSRAYLAGFLAFRVYTRKGDSRFENVRESVCKTLAAFSYQILWVFTVSAPVIFVIGVGNGPVSDDVSDLVASDYIGLALGSIGALCEIIADVQKFKFRADPSNNTKVCDVGLWALSRHPNYLGEVLLWWGIFILGVQVFKDDPAGWSTVVSPVFTMLLLLLGSGVPTAEGSALKRFYSTRESAAAFSKYFESTPPLFCCCCGMYTWLPSWLKLALCCEFPFYRYKEQGANAEATESLSSGDEVIDLPPTLTPRSGATNYDSTVADGRI